MNPTVHDSGRFPIEARWITSSKKVYGEIAAEAYARRPNYRAYLFASEELAFWPRNWESDVFMILDSFRDLAVIKDPENSTPVLTHHMIELLKTTGPLEEQEYWQGFWINIGERSKRLFAAPLWSTEPMTLPELPHDLWLKDDGDRLVAEVQREAALQSRGG